jgi:RNA polymerase sigma-70 factor, ECF subfamily
VSSVPPSAEVDRRPVSQRTPDAASFPSALQLPPEYNVSVRPFEHYSTTPADRAYIDGIRRRDSRVESDFFVQFQPQCSSIARRAGIRYPDSDDVTLEALAAALLQVRSGRFREETPLRAWLFCILRNRIVSYRRKQTQTVSIDSLISDSREDTLPQTSSNLTATMFVRQMLSTLSKRHRQVLLLNRLGGYTTRQIAEMIRRSPGRTGAVLAEAKQQLRESITTQERPTFRRNVSAPRADTVRFDPVTESLLKDLLSSESSEICPHQVTILRRQPFTHCGLQGE